MVRKLYATLMAIGLVAIGLVPAQAVQGGTDAVGDDHVAAIIRTGELFPYCSASYVNSWVVVTAAHCVTRLGSNKGELDLPAENYWVSGPGENVTLGAIEKRIRVKEIIRREGYVNVWSPNTGDIRTQVDDIAFLVLEKEAVGIKALEIATPAEIADLKSKMGTIRHIGYGDQAANLKDGKPYQVFLKSRPLGSKFYNGGTHPALETNTVASIETGDKALCSGDSGSPWYSTFDNKEKLVAVLVAASGCGRGSGTAGTIGTAVSPYLDLLDVANKKASEIKASIVPTPTPTPTPQVKLETSQAWIGGFFGSTIELTQRQKSSIKKLAGTKSVQKGVICYGIVSSGFTAKAALLARKRAKSVCDYAKRLDPLASYHYLTKPSSAAKYQGKVLLFVESAS